MKIIFSIFFCVLFIISAKAQINNQEITCTKTSVARRSLEGKTAIITGAGKGIGREIARVFAEEGANVVLSSRTETDLQTLTDEINKNGGTASFFVGDITKLDDMKKMAAFAVAQYGRIDILVHNAAGLYPKTPVEDISPELWKEALSTNLDAVFYATHSVIPYMKSQNYGRIVFTSSISGPRVGLSGKSHYTAAKGGMNGFMKTIAIELAKYHITVNAVEPGNIETEGLLRVCDEKVLDERRKPVPMKRLGTARETAMVHRFLASDEASYITGQSIIVDGGLTLPETHFGEY